MNVVHIGSNTGGKYTASWTIHAYDTHKGRAINLYDEKKLTESEKNTLENGACNRSWPSTLTRITITFSSTGHLVPDHPLKRDLVKYLLETPWGDTKDGAVGSSPLPDTAGMKAIDPFAPDTLGTREQRVREDILSPGR